MTRHKSLPLYVKVAETIKGRILNEQYSPGDMIPPARELSEEFEVSNITIRKAIESLSRDGFLEPRQGVGTMVAPTRDRDLVEVRITGNFRQWLDSASGRKLSVQAELLEMSTIRPPERARHLLALPPNREICRLKRIRRLQGRPISYFINYAPADTCRSIGPEDVAEKSFIEIFQEKLDINLIRMEQRVEAVMADMELAGMLETDFGAPLFFIENVYFSDEAAPVLLTHMYYRGDRYVYKATIPLGSPPQSRG